MEEVIDNLIDLIENRLDKLDLPIDAEDLDEIRCTMDDVLSKYDQGEEEWQV